ncbi:FecR domain-containing protein [uncultured Sunxiuqinia sp.]|uniref:FecR family protein n=1 Tax=uncultured Sunxiuqinia sp. TaxID=1573825 RepID=UPI002607B37B|nr:FecR domain-containing protein [uncultured Sunxiuqinia sp.]
MSRKKQDREKLIAKEGDAERRKAGPAYLSGADIFSTDEFNDAESLLSSLSKFRNDLPEEEKRLLGSQINQSIYKYQKQRRWGKLGIAASILLIVGFAATLQILQMSDFRVYVKNIAPVEKSASTRLFLSGEQEIVIDTEESKIEYTQAGDQVKIDAVQAVDQQLTGKKMAFNTVVVPYGKRTMLLLSDSSRVWLNSGSRLVYPARFETAKREVYLEGEAVFEVSHNPAQPFHVITQNLEVKVLGTVFNLTAYTDEQTTQTVLESGSVELEFDGDEFWGKSQKVIEPGTLAVYDSQSKLMEQKQVNTKSYTSWREGFLFVEHQPLKDILRKVARYYNADIQIKEPDLGNETFSGYLDLRSSVDQVLEVVAEFMAIKVETNNEQIMISRI